MAEQRKVRFIVERQDGPTEKPYTQEFEVAYRVGLNVVAALMEIQKNPVTVDGKRVGVQLPREGLRCMHDGHQRQGAAGVLCARG